MKGIAKPRSSVPAHDGPGVVQPCTSVAARSGSTRSWFLVSVVLVALVLLALLLTGMAGIPVGRAVSASTLPQAESETPGNNTLVATNTVFLPLIQYEPTVPNVWRGEYYTNAGLSGDPAYTTTEARVDYDWGDDGAPAGLPKNQFSIRWTGRWEFEAGEYTFFGYADDGVRFWLDGQLLFDYWQPGQGYHEETVDLATGGLHQMKLEYFEGQGDAAIYLHWRRTDLFPEWNATYYTNPWVESAPAYSDADTVIQFDWGTGCPGGLPCDAFSVEWKASPLFESGSHHIFVFADEGYRFFVDGSAMTGDGWIDGEPDNWYALDVAGKEHHPIAFQVHDRGGNAEARLWIEDTARPDWTAEYFNNTNLSGSPVKTFQEEAVFYDWGLGRPRAGINTNHFSVRWSGPRYFHAGSYIFGVFADDGVRLRVDGELLVDEWHLGRAEYSSPITYLSTGYHDIAVEYFDSSGEAEIRYWWE